MVTCSCYSDVSSNRNLVFLFYEINPNNEVWAQCLIIFFISPPTNFFCHFHEKLFDQIPFFCNFKPEFWLPDPFTILSTIQFSSVLVIGVVNWHQFLHFKMPNSWVIMHLDLALTTDDDALTYICKLLICSLRLIFILK